MTYNYKEIKTISRTIQTMKSLKTHNLVLLSPTRKTFILVLHVAKIRYIQIQRGGK